MSLPTASDSICGAMAAALTEEHYWPADGELGYRRNWNENGKTICEEYYFCNGKGLMGSHPSGTQEANFAAAFPTIM